MAKTEKGRGRKTPAEFRFKIEAYTPETMPMVRLAEYLQELAAVLGEVASVHLVGLEPGSTVLCHHIQREAVPKVLDRAAAIRRNEGPRDAMVAYRKINGLLREDNARAVFRKFKRGTRVLEFPGIDEAEEPYPSVKQYGTIAGRLIRIGGPGDSIPILLESDDAAPLAGCHANRDVAKPLAAHLFEMVNLNGHGYWMRDKCGEWSLKHFRVDSFDVLTEKPLATALAELREVVGDMAESAIDEVIDQRSGGFSNGRG